MLSYETLDSIADAYNPLLAILSLSIIVESFFGYGWRLAALRIAALALVLLAAYGLMFLDVRLNIWSMFGLDYSTHTAVALALVAFLSVNKPNLLILWLGSLIAYILLMLYQGYHTVLDIAVTCGVLIPVWFILAFLYCRWPFATANISFNPDSEVTRLTKR